MTDTGNPHPRKPLVDEERLDDIAVAPGEEQGKAEGDKGDDDACKDAPRNADNLEEGLEESMDGSDVPSAIQP